MKRLMIAAALLLSACATTTVSEAPMGESALGSTDAYALSIVDPRRPSSEVARDPLRHPAEMLEFIGLRPGMRIADIRPEEGYFTRLFAPVVGDTGRVYAFVPTLTATREQPFADQLAADYGNVTPMVGLLDEMTFDQPLDVVFMGQEYHDFHIDRFDVDVAEMNRRVFAALRPGGLYVILDHSGRPGTGHSEVQTLHRIEGASLRAEVEAAGFVFEGESTVLANPEDDRTISVFDESIRGRTDQFVYRFRKPE